MHAKNIAEQLFKEQLISGQSLSRITTYEDTKKFSVNTHIKTFLYLGVTLLAAGLGILIYKNINNTGHAVLVTFIGLLSAVCFAYCSFNSHTFSRSKVVTTGLLFDYILLLGALTLVTFIGYLQFEFNFFGEQWELALFIPCIALFLAAYFFDHRGVLGMAIVLLGSWAGIAVTPLELFKKNDFSGYHFIYTGIALALFLAAAAYSGFKFNFKKHFSFTYLNFALHTGFVAALSGLFASGNEWLWCFIIAMFFTAGYKYAYAQKSFYVLLMCTLYAYVALSYLMIRFATDFIGGHDMTALYILLIYFIFSAMVLIKYLRQFKKDLQTI